MIPEKIADDPALYGQFKVALADALIAEFGESDWKRLAITYSLQREIIEHPRFLRSLSWGDEDYAGHVLFLVEHLTFQRESVVSALMERRDIQGWFGMHQPKMLAVWQAEGDPLVEALADALDEISDAGRAVDLASYKSRIRQALPHDPAAAIGATKDMLEAVMRTILVQRDAEEDVDSLDFPALANKSFHLLGLKTMTAPSSDREKYLRQIASSAQKMMEAANALRNYGGTGHGRAASSEPDLSPMDGQLVAATEYVLAARLLRHHKDLP